LMCRRIVVCNFLAILILGFMFTSGFGEERDKWQQPDRIIDTLGIRQGMVIGEVGAGEGYFTFKLARRVGPSGHIYANDIVQRVLDQIDTQCRNEQISNVTTILGKVEDPLFPPAKLDLVVMMRVFHDLSRPVKLINNIIPALKPGALLVIIDPDPEKLKKDQKHFYTRNKILTIMQESKFILIKLLEFLPQDNIFIYRSRE
jgi:ubiquinone/menaquinone biosynthesis C-methylase UbiE